MRLKAPKEVLKGVCVHFSNEILYKKCVMDFFVCVSSPGQI